jgi:TRAP-type mannitol/chloroaromatic compound transport system permease small subunit
MGTSMSFHLSFKWLENAISFIDNFTEYTGKLIAWLTFAMVVISFAIVVLRYGFNLGWVAMQESVLYFHGIVFMLGAAYTLKADGHVRVDIFYQRFTKKQQALVNLFGALFLLSPVCITICIISFDYVSVSWRIMEKSSEAGGLPLVYLNKSLILLFAFTLFLQGLAEIGRNFLIIKSNNPQSMNTSGDM